MWRRFDKSTLARSFPTSVIMATLVFLGGQLALWWSNVAQALRATLETMTGIGLLIAFFTPLAQAIRVGMRDAKPFDLDAAIRTPNYESHIGFLRTFEENFTHVVATITNEGRWPLVVFIDDLDRCAPPKPVEIIEALNHLIDAQHCVFILGMDEQMVVKSIEAKYRTLAGAVAEEGGAYIGALLSRENRPTPISHPTAKRACYASLHDPTLAHTSTSRLPIQQMEEPIEQPRARFADDATSLSDQTIEQLVETIQTERRARAAKSGYADLPSPDEITQLIGRTFDEQSMNQAIEIIEQRWGESPVVQETIVQTLPLLEYNPRQTKRFINIFRLQTILTREIRLPPQIPEHERLSLLAKAVILWMR